MGLSCTVSKINSDFSRIHNLFSPTPVYFMPLLMGFFFEFGIGTKGPENKNE